MENNELICVNPLGLLKEHAGIMAILPTLKDGEDIEGYSELFLDKNIKSKKELVGYCLDIERQLRKSKDERAKLYLDELKFQRDNQRLENTFSKLEQESIRGGEILKKVWDKCIYNVFEMDYSDSGKGLLKQKSHLYIKSYYPDNFVKITYYSNGNNLNIYLEDKSKLIDKILGKNIINASIKKTITEKDYPENIHLNNVIKVMDGIILNNNIYSKSMKNFKQIILNLPEIMNSYIEKQLK